MSAKEMAKTRDEIEQPARLNHARREAEAMDWPEFILDREGDLQCEIELLRSDLSVWRAVALFAVAALFIVSILIVFGGL